jgi:nucleoside-diphosphate-sugar epimerase
MAHLTYRHVSAGSSRHVLVVGGAGYVGNVLIRRLLAAGYRVRILDRLIFDHGTALAGVFEDPGLSFVHGDLRDADTVRSALEGITDAVLLAGLVGDPVCSTYPDLARSVNGDGVRATYDLLAEHGLDRFVFTSTCSNYGLRETSEPATESSELAPLSLYAEAKVEFEQYVLGRDDADICPTILRIATAYGLSQRMRFDLTISEFTRTLTIGDELVVYDADTWRPYCHVDDISTAIITVLESPEDAVRREVFNVGHSDENYTKRMVVDAVQEHLRGRGRVSFVEGGKDARNYRVSFDRIREHLGFMPSHRVPESIGRLITAIEAGAFDDVADRPTFYTNHTVTALEEVAAVHATGDGGD